ncbi:MAG: zinc-binding dehydrogenase [Gammaproteobacteria bacterium]|nr:zinc-binding dehydrogenase [Gammaproteobacteria bacterium]
MRVASEAVSGEGGAVGTALLQLGDLAGLETYGRASEPKHELVADLGATSIDHRSEDFVARVRALTEQGVDAVFDTIGGDGFKRSPASFEPGGSPAAHGFHDSVMDRGGSVPASSCGSCCGTSSRTAARRSSTGSARCARSVRIGSAGI